MSNKTNQQNDKCAKCGLARHEHHYNGACYGVCGEFVEPHPDQITPGDGDGLQALADEIEMGHGLILMTVLGTTSQLGIKKTAQIIAALRAPTRDVAEEAVPVGEDTPYWRTLRAALVLPVEEQYAIAKDLAANCGYELTGDAYTAPAKPAPDAMREALLSHMTRLGLALGAYQQKHDIENRDMAKQIGISASTLSRIKGGTMPDALGIAKIILWLSEQT